LIIVSENGTVQLVFTGKNPMYLIKSDDSSSHKSPLKKGQFYFLKHGDRFSLLQDKYWFTVHIEPFPPPPPPPPPQQQQQQQESMYSFSMKNSSLSSSSPAKPITFASPQCVPNPFRKIVSSPKKPSLLFQKVQTTSPSKKKENGVHSCVYPPPLSLQKLTTSTSTATSTSTTSISAFDNTTHQLHASLQTATDSSHNPNTNSIQNTAPTPPNVQEHSSKSAENELIESIDSDSNNSDQFPFSLSQKRKREDSQMEPPNKYAKIEAGTYLNIFISLSHSFYF
jgi:hypothetical protein